LAQADFGLRWVPSGAARGLPTSSGMVQQRFSALDRIKRRWEPTFEELGSAKIPNFREGVVIDEDFVQDFVPLPPGSHRLGGRPTWTDVGAADADAGAIATAALEAARAPRGEVIVMPGPLQGGNLGLAINKLEVTGITDPAASSFGWSIGDRILAINGVSVASQEQLRVVVHYALQEYAAYQKPLVFEVMRSKTIVSDGKISGDGSASGSTSRKQRDDCCCCLWWFCGEYEVTARQEGYPTQEKASKQEYGLYGYDVFQYARPAHNQHGEPYPYLPGIPTE